MSLWNTIKGWLAKSSENESREEKIERPEPELADSETPTQILVRVLLLRGINIREISIMKLESLFENWYDGPTTEQAVLEALPEFKKRYGISFADEGRPHQKQ